MPAFFPVPRSAGWRWMGVVLSACALVVSAIPLVAAPPKWVRVDAPSFRLYAEASEKEALAWARDFELFRRAVMDWINVSPTQLQPAHIVLFRNEGSFRPFIPLRDGKRMELSSYIRSHGALPTTIATHRDVGDGSRQSLFFGGVSWMLSGFEERGPEWFQTGLAEVFSTFEIQKERYRIGAAQDDTALYLGRHGVPRLSELLATDRASLRYRGDDGTAAFHAHSWLVIHYLMFGEQNARAGRMGQVLARMNQGRTASEAVTEVFEKSPEWFDRALERYVAGGRYLIFHSPLDRTGFDTLFKTSEPSPAEVKVAQGRLFLSLNQADDAARFFGQADLADASLPEVQTAWGDLALIRNDTAEALRRYEAAAAAGSKDARVYFALADHLVRTGAIGAAGVPRYEGAAARRAANQLERSINLYPYYVPAYARLVTLLPSVNRVTEHDKNFLEAGQRLRPNDPLLRVGLAILDLRQGQTDAARARFDEVAALDPKDFPLAVAVAREQLAHLTVGGDFAAAKTALAEGRIEEAEQLVNNLLALAESAAHRRELLELRKELTRHTQLRRAAQHLEAGRWRDALVVLEALAEDTNLSAELRARVETLTAEAKSFEKRV